MSYRLKLIFVAFSALLLSACERGDYEPVPEQNKEYIPVQIVLGGLATPSVVSNRTVGGGAISIAYNEGGIYGLTRSIADDPDYKLGDVVLLQFNDAGDLVSTAHLDDLSSATPQVSGNELIYAPSLSLQPAAASTIYAIANTGDASLFASVQTIDDFESLEREVPHANAIFVSGLLPMTGKYAGPVDDETDIRIEMERMFAKFAVTVNVGTLSDGRILELDKVQLKSAPTTALYAHKFKGYNFTGITNGTDEQGYPGVPGSMQEVIDLTRFTDYEAQPLDPGVQSTVTFYMPENIRGKGSNYTQQIYKNADADHTKNFYKSWTGAKGHEKGVSTRLWLSGKYETQADGLMDILMTLYPGDDIINDFNIRRNTLYDLTININDVRPAWYEDEETDFMGDYRIYVWAAAGETNTRADLPEIMPMFHGDWRVEIYGSYYLDPADELDSVEFIITFPDGTMQRPAVSPLHKGDGIYTFDVSVFASPALEAGWVVRAQTILHLKNGRVVSGPEAMSTVRPRA